MNDVAVQSKPRGPMEVFKAEVQMALPEFQRALPPHIPVERFMRVLTTAVQTSMAKSFTNLLECNRRSLFQAVMRAAQDGLLPDGREGAILKYGDDAQWLPMVAGIRKKARNSGEISTWDAHCVYKNDKFLLRLGADPTIEHSFDLSVERGDLIGAYSVALLKDGSKSFEVMTIAEIRAIRDRSQAWTAFKNGKIKSTPWSTDEAEMARKTVAKRHSKQLPSSADLDDLMRQDDHLYDTAKEPEKAPAPLPKGQRALDQFAAGMSSAEDVVETKPEQPAARTAEPKAATVKPAPAKQAEEPAPRQAAEPPAKTDGDIAEDEGVEAAHNGLTTRAMPQGYVGTELEARWLAGHASVSRGGE